MTKMLKYLPILALAILTGCNDNQPEEADINDSLTLVINIKDMVAASRATTASGVNEQINTLRVIIAKPDGVVEANRLLRPNGSMLGENDLRFKTTLDPYKTVVLIANEVATGKSYDNISTFEPEALNDPSSYPKAHLVNEIIDNQLPTAQTSVPMTAIYKLGTKLEDATKMGDGHYEIRYDLCLMRTVTKFTFNVYNNRTIPVDISEIGINLIEVNKYYLFPRVKDTSGKEIIHYMNAEGTELSESGTGLKPADDKGVAITSSFSEHYRTNFCAAEVGKSWYTFTDEKKQIEPAAEPLVLEYYYYESNLPADADSDTPYTLYVDFEDNRYYTSLDQLPSLPRNTHVVVNIKFNNNDKNLEIEVLPYQGVNLNPGFGI